jgi:hypothetical protein
MSKLLEAIVELGSQSCCLALYGSVSSLALAAFGYPFREGRSRKGRTWHWACSKSTQHVLLMRILERVQPTVVSARIVCDFANDPPNGSDQASG